MPSGASSFLIPRNRELCVMSSGKAEPYGAQRHIPSAYFVSDSGRPHVGIPFLSYTTPSQKIPIIKDQVFAT